MDSLVNKNFKKLIKNISKRFLDFYIRKFYNYIFYVLFSNEEKNFLKYSVVDKIILILFIFKWYSLIFSQNNFKVGIGSGSTVVYAVNRIGKVLIPHTLS